jgi:hypothetical protein
MDNNNKYSIKRQMIREAFDRRAIQKKQQEEYIICLIYYFIILFMIYAQVTYISKNYYIK